MPKKTLPVLIVFLVLIAGVAFWLRLAPGLKTETLVIADASQPMFALLYIADAKGYLREEGLNVTYKSFTSGRDALNSAISGEADIATVFETPIVQQYAKGKKIGVVSTLHHSSLNTALVFHTNRGIKTPSDLAGKTIAVTKNTNGEFFLNLFLTSNSIKESEVTLVNTKPQEMVNVLKDGAVDAVATWNPHVANAIHSFGAGKVKTFYSDIYTEMSFLAGQREVIVRKQEAVTRLLKAIIRAEAFLRDNNEQAFQLVIKRFPGGSETIIRKMWNNFTAEAMLNNVMLSIFKQEAEWFRKIGKLKTHLPDFRDVIMPEYLAKLKPESVTVLLPR